MGVRERRIAEENELIIAAGQYTAPDGTRVRIADAVEQARTGTRVFDPEQLAGLLAGNAGGADSATRGTTRTEVTGEGTLEAAGRLAREGARGIAALNFASARKPGGGYLTGARSQEEDLCRASALHTCLLAVPEYYAVHRASDDLRYSDRVVHSPDVPVFRDSPTAALLPQPYAVSFLTCAAPNTGALARRDPAAAATAPAVLRHRAAGVLAVAAAHGHRTLVLGAWGCGVFGNDPRHVAAAFHEHLADGGAFHNRFDRVVFAVLDHLPGQPNLTAFRTAFPAA